MLLWDFYSSSKRQGVCVAFIQRAQLWDTVHTEASMCTAINVFLCIHADFYIIRCISHIAASLGRVSL